MCVRTRVLKSRARCDLNGRPAAVATLYRVPRGFAVVSAITTGCEIGPFRSGGIEAAPPTQILVGYLFARSEPLFSLANVPRCFLAVTCPICVGDYFKSRYRSDTKFLGFFGISCFSKPAKRSSINVGHEHRRLYLFFPFEMFVLID